MVIRFQHEKIAEGAFLAPNATVLGDVSVMQRSSIWFGAVVRGDTERIEIGEETNIQDLCVLHADVGLPCVIGNRVTVGHAAIVHGARIEDEVLIGMRAVILNGAVIGSGTLIAAGTIVPEGTTVPPNSLVMGVPGKVRRETNSTDRDRIVAAARHYAELRTEYVDQ